MDFKTFRSQVTAPSWLSIANELIPHQGSIRLSKTESQALLNDARDAIARNDVASAQNALYAGLLFDEERFLFQIQKKGILRASRFSYVTEPLATIVKTLLNPDLGLSDVVVTYLNSLSNLYSVAADIRSLYVSLRDWLHEEREQGIKSALAWLDFTFLEYNVGVREPCKDGQESNEPGFFEAEELAEGFSTILAIYSQEFGSLEVNTSINEVGLMEGIYATRLNMAAHISTFREWEFSIDRQGFTLIPTETPNVWRLCHPSQEFLRSVELGFIHSLQQRMITSYAARETGCSSIHAIGHSMMPLLEQDGSIKIEDHPIRRLRIEVRSDLLAKLKEIEELLQEEWQALENASRDLLTPVEEILEFELQDGLTFKDIFLVARAIDFIRSITAARMIPEIENDLGLVLQSIVPAFELGDLVSLLSQLVGKEVAQKAIEIWTTDIDGHVDIQYRPLIQVGATRLFPMNIFGASNSFRNALQILEKRLYEDGANDPLSSLVVKTFEAQGVPALRGLTYGDGEIDALSFIDGKLFAFECKNSLLPTGSHELMTSLDYVRTASKQLDRFTERFADIKFRKWLSQTTGWSIDSSTTLSTCIVLSNRMFMGFRGLGHPVRNPYELKHFVEEGTFCMDTESVCLWLGNEFTGEDLRRYLEEDTTYHPQWDSLVTWSASYHFANCCVLVDHLSLDIMKLAQHFGLEKAINGMKQQHEIRQNMLAQYSFPEFYQSRIAASQRRSESESQ